MLLSESKKLSRIKEQLDGWNAITDLLSSEYNKTSKTQNLQKLLQMCSGVEIDQRATVRRWIRSGKLTASKSSKKVGNVITSAALNQFVT